MVFKNLCVLTRALDQSSLSIGWVELLDTFCQRHVSMDIYILNEKSVDICLQAHDVFARDIMSKSVHKNKYPSIQ